MKIEFNNDADGYKRALLFKSLLEYAGNKAMITAVDENLIIDIQSELDNFLSQPDLLQYKSDNSNYLNLSSLTEASFINQLIHSLKTLFGPGKQEQQLSRERKKLLERAERAEAMAYESLAETADVGRQRDSALKQLDELQQNSKET